MSIIGPQGVDVTRVSTTPEFLLGNEVSIVTNDGGRTDYRYCQANGAVALGEAVTIDDDNQAVAATTTTAGAKPQLAGIGRVAFADNEYGWFAIGPIAKAHGVVVLAFTACAPDVKLYTTATAGQVDDASTTLIQGLALDTLVGGAPANTVCYSHVRLAVN